MVTEALSLLFMILVNLTSVGDDGRTRVLSCTDIQLIIIMHTLVHTYVRPLNKGIRFVLI